MIKKILTIVIGLLTPFLAIAGVIDQQAAQQIAERFAQLHGVQGVEYANQPSASRMLVSSTAVPSSLHVFNMGHSEGFVIVSGDDRTEEILGYSDHGSFDAERMPENMRCWLQSYHRQLSALAQNTPPKKPF